MHQSSHDTLMTVKSKSTKAFTEQVHSVGNLQNDKENNPPLIVTKIIHNFTA